ncbi:uncharacterized protein LOC131612176 [Vicia villosa]|uniref:uncharacterized protein LOC131612176 n=1 Tax=Vicia villosa TaxID=3911 RepID=UPI00273BEE59|nr:uncharacterized protein LOC131612176 [Vicia villosa]
MGKDWYWGARKSSKKTTPQSDIPSGCMCALFQTFDFHPFHFSINQPQQQQHSPIHSISKQPEAPRNSLESQDEQSFKIPKNIRTRGGSFNDLSSDVSSPGTKTPTLVARLMGLDLLPDANSPSSSSSSSLSTPSRQSHYHTRPKPDKIKIMKHRHSTDSVIMRSLPETPRLSSERTSSSFVEHRLSLQINKENMINHGEDLDTPPRFSFSKIRKHVKESVGGRKVGKDITNNPIKNTKQQEQEQEKEDFVGQIKFKKPLKPLKPLEESNQGKHSNASHSPRLSRFNDNSNINNHKHSPTLKDQTTHQVPKQSSPPPLVNMEAQVSRVSTKTKTQAMSEKEMMIKDKKSFPKCKKTAPHGNTSPRINKNQQTTIVNKQQESFIIRPSSSTTKTKKTHPLSNNTLLLKTHPSPTDTKIPQKQVNDDIQESKNMSQLFGSSRQKYTLRNQTTNNESNSNSSIAAGAKDKEPEYQYITTILNRTGIHQATTTNLQHFQWFSSTHPLDPSIFHRLELYPNIKDNKFTQKNHLGPRCNRRLLFDLLDEVLSEILTKPNSHRGLLLLDTVWNRVRSFPRAKCEVLEDIDGLIEMKDMMDKIKEEEEGEKVVAEIEGKVLEMLVNETITVMVGPNR